METDTTRTILLPRSVVLKGSIAVPTDVALADVDPRLVRLTTDRRSDLLMDPRRHVFHRADLHLRFPLMQHLRFTQNLLLHRLDLTTWP